MTKRVLITGVAGFLGSMLAEWILQNVEGVAVYGVDDLSCGYLKSVPQGCQIWEYSLGEGNLHTTPIWHLEWDYVFHLAAWAAEGLSPFMRMHNYRSNCVATAEVIDLCVERGCGRMVFTSSVAAYGNPLSCGVHKVAPPFDEDLICHPIDPYGVAKLACEQDLCIAGDQHGLDWCVLRPFNIYGPGQSLWQKYRNVLGMWMLNTLLDQPSYIYGDGKQKRAFTYVDDILPCLWQAATTPQASRQVINLGSDQPCTLNEAASALRRCMPEVKFVYAPERHEAKAAYCNVSKSRELLGFTEATPLHVGLERMAAWARMAHARWPERSKHQGRGVGRLEISRGLYPFWRELLPPQVTPGPLPAPVGTHWDGEE